MNRPLPSRPEAEIVAMAIFEPSGTQYLAVAITGTPVDVLYTRDQVDQLEEKIAAFKRAVTFEDARPIERPRRHREPL
jgi:hypothetical protein